jgi:hypothetical protein
MLMNMFKHTKAAHKKWAIDVIKELIDFHTIEYHEIFD